MGEDSRSGRRRAMVPAAAVSLALLAVACGGGSSAPVAAGNKAYQSAVAYARCMRSHGLEHRPASETRSVPIPPELIRILRRHIDTFGTASDGRLFGSDRGNVVASTAISDVWAEARTRALTPEQVSSPLAGRPYDLRHAAVSLWLNAGVSPQDVAQRAGHSVEVLLRVYAKCLHGGEAIANKRIEAALNDA
jgi:integrase